MLNKKKLIFSYIKSLLDWWA